MSTTGHLFSLEDAGLHLKHFSSTTAEDWILGASMTMALWRKMPLKKTEQAYDAIIIDYSLHSHYMTNEETTEGINDRTKPGYMVVWCTLNMHTAAAVSVHMALTI